jgi:hypothetical protein
MGNLGEEQFHQQQAVGTSRAKAQAQEGEEEHLRGTSRGAKVAGGAFGR